MTPTPAPPPPKTNGFGRVLKYQHLSDFATQLTRVKTDKGLKTLRSELNRGSEYMDHFHAFSESERKQAYVLLRERAEQMGYRWEGIYRDYVLINSPEKP